MGILGSGSSGKKKGSAITIVSAGSSLVGELALEDNLQIEGKFKGMVSSKADVTIRQGGQVEGEIKARRILVSGSFHGQIEAEQLEITASGQVSGEISVIQLVVQSGALFNGTSHIRGEQPPKGSPVQVTEIKADREQSLISPSGRSEQKAARPVTA